jgi:phosphoserine aminotransferase
MTHRVINFNPGPAALPLAVLERAQSELLDFQGTGMSILEHSHRGNEYERVHDEAISLLIELIGLPDTHQVLLMQGGASMQFALIPMNLRSETHAGDYVISGVWAQKAYDEAALLGKPSIAADSGRDGRYIRVPKASELVFSPHAPYVHLTSNNTIFGTQFREFPNVGDRPLVVDMSSDILSRPIDAAKFGLIYAGAQKNLGPAGVTVVIIRKDLIERGRKDIPKIFRYAVHAKENSLYNTAPTFSIYMLRNTLAWLKERGGVAAIAQQNQAKGVIVYEAIDGSGGFYRSPVERESRSLMNVVFRLPSEPLDEAFVAEAKKVGLVGLKGHRLAGGIRASLYNAVSLDDTRKLVTFMDRFQRANS